MIRTSRMLSVKIPISVLSEDPGEKSIEVVVLEPPKPASTLILGSRIFRERPIVRQ